MHHLKFLSFVMSAVDYSTVSYCARLCLFLFLTSETSDKRITLQSFRCTASLSQQSTSIFCSTGATSFAQRPRHLLGECGSVSHKNPKPGVGPYDIQRTQLSRNSGHTSSRYTSHFSPLQPPLWASKAFVWCLLSSSFCFSRCSIFIFIPPLFYHKVPRDKSFFPRGRPEQEVTVNRYIT